MKSLTSVRDCIYFYLAEIKIVLSLFAQSLLSTFMRVMGFSGLGNLLYRYLFKCIYTSFVFTYWFIANNMLIAKSVKHICLSN